MEGHSHVARGRQEGWTFWWGARGGAHCLSFIYFFSLEVNCSLEIKHPANGGGGWEDEEEEVGGLYMIWTDGGG